MNITRLNHAVLYVSDAAAVAGFYRDVLGFRTVIRDPHNHFAFLRAKRSENHHDLALFTVGAGARRPARGQSLGLYHLAWEVPTLKDLAAARVALEEAGALVGQSDHGVNKSLYAEDPDGNEFEVMWLVPPDQWGAEESQAIVRGLDLDADRRRYGATRTSWNLEVSSSKAAR